MNQMTDTKKRNVLIGGGGTGTAFAIATRLQALWHDRLRLIVTDIYDRDLVTTSLLADAFHQVPRADDPNFAQVLGQILEEEAIDIYIPLLNAEIRAAWTLPKTQHLDIWLAGPGPELLDKAAADPWLQAQGVRVPQQLSDLQGRPDDETWFVKPRDGFGSRGARALSVAEIRALDAEERAGSIIQEICKTPEITIDSFYDAETGFTRAYCRERLETKSGVCTKARVSFHPELAEIASKIGAGLGQRGAICFQAMRGQAGWCVTDLNLRPGAGTALTVAAGYDVLAASYACRTGESYEHFVPEIAPDAEILVTRQYSEFVMSRRP